MRYILLVTYLEGLNDAQRRAVLAKDGPVSVLAGAGSGKTRVLTTRVYHLIREGIPADKILAVTFTNKAAREMRGRVRAMLGDEGPVPFVATFHGLGRELLESYGKAVGIPRYFSIYDRDDSEKAITVALKALDIETKELSPRAVLGRISRQKGEGMRAQEFALKHGRSSFGNRIVSEVWQRYEKTLASEKALDFDDLVALPVQMLEEHEDIRELAQNRWSHIHIDEYQDTNSLQEKLAGILAEKHKNLFVVGDGDQAIYGWRGAKMENILNFEKKYSTTEKMEGEPIIIHIALNAEDEARWIALRIKQLMSEGIKPEEIAILYRTNFQSRALEEGLLRAGVPYKILGTRFFGRKEVKDALAWMRLAMDPSREVDKIRAAASPSRGLGKVTLGKLAAGQRATLRAGELAKVEAFERVIDELAAAASSP